MLTDGRSVGLKSSAFLHEARIHLGYKKAMPSFVPGITPTFECCCGRPQLRCLRRSPHLRTRSARTQALISFGWTAADAPQAPVADWVPLSRLRTTVLQPSPTI